MSESFKRTLKDDLGLDDASLQDMLDKATNVSAVTATLSPLTHRPLTSMELALTRGTQSEVTRQEDAPMLMPLPRADAPKREARLLDAVSGSFKKSLQKDAGMTEEQMMEASAITVSPDMVAAGRPLRPFVLTQEANGWTDSDRSPRRPSRAPTASAY